MKSIKSIQEYDVADIEGDSGNVINAVTIQVYSLIGMTQFNENFVSTIMDRIVNIAVIEEEIDNFLCFFLKNRIVLTEKKRCKNKFKDLIKKKYWSSISLANLLYVAELDQKYFFLFENVDANLIIMNNNTEILVPLFGKV